MPVQRKEYTHGALNEADVKTDPITQFEGWFHDAVHANLKLPDAMTLATVSPEGIPDARIVLLKAVNPEGFVFYTNFMSPKGDQLEQNPNAALVFWWPEFERQVRVRGHLQKTDDKVADTYFATRPRSAQLGAWASPQSMVIADRNMLDDNMAQMEQRFAGKDVPRPSHWGGFCLTPLTIEFWQGRENRLHDRLFFRRDDAGTWHMSRLAP